LLSSIFVGLNVPYKYIYCDFHPPELKIDAERHIYVTVTGSSTHKKICCLSYPQLTYDTYVDFLLNSSRSICFPEISHTYGDNQEFYGYLPDNQLYHKDMGNSSL
jgi:hypothetical protein